MTAIRSPGHHSLQIGGSPGAPSPAIGHHSGNFGSKANSLTYGADDLNWSFYIMYINVYIQLFWAQIYLIKAVLRGKNFKSADPT